MKGNEIMHIMVLAPFLAQSKCSISGSHGNIRPRFLLLGDLIYTGSKLKQQPEAGPGLGRRNWWWKDMICIIIYILRKLFLFHNGTSLLKQGSTIQ